METAALRVVAKEARVPLAPSPVFWYSPKRTPEVRVSLVLQTDHPAELMAEDMEVYWKTTWASCRQGRPR